MHVYPSVKIWAPWNLVMEDGSCLGHAVDCYNVAKVRIGENAIVSQYTYLCTASHDYEDPGFSLLAGAITVGPKAWIAADVFVGPGVTIGAMAVIGARSTVLRDIGERCVAVGHPAVAVKMRGSRQSSVRRILDPQE